MAEKHRVYLIPGFFGFANLGDLLYFGHVRRTLAAELERRGVDAEIFEVPSHPTGSVRTRTNDLLQTLARTAGEDGPIHLIGHSTGALDARLLVSPCSSLEPIDGQPPPELFVPRIRTLVSVSAPHLGTGLASFFSSLMGAHLLQLLSLFTVYVLRFGRIPLSVVLKLAGVVMKLDTYLGFKQTLFDQVFEELLGDFSPERRTALARFLDQVVDDQSLVRHLSPEEMGRFDSEVTDCASIRYGCVVTQARAPQLADTLANGLDPYAQFTHSVYRILYSQARLDGVAPPTLTPQQARGLERAYGSVPGADASDGIVPTSSQLHGQLVGAVHADHLDVIGHFEESTSVPPHIDWLISNTGFRRPDFTRLWADVTTFLLEESPPGSGRNARPGLGDNHRREV